MPALTKTNYFYIDESGNLENNSRVFISGCVRTDAPKSIEQSLNQLVKSLQRDPYFAEISDNIARQGFHAVDNHPDVRARFYSVLSALNFRAFFVIINKQDKCFSELLSKCKADGIYKMTLHKLLRGRLQNNYDKNKFYFEQLTIGNKDQKRIVQELFTSVTSSAKRTFEIVSKTNKMMSLCDYMNYVLFQLFENPKKPPERMVQNFDLLKPKIGLINYFNEDVYFNRGSRRIELKKILDLLTG